MEAAEVVRSYKQLSRVERDFRVIKGPDLEVAPIRHRLSERTSAHFLICQLAAYVRWHMERDLAPCSSRMNPRLPLKTRWHWPGVLPLPSTKPAASATTTASRSEASARCWMSWPP